MHNKINKLFVLVNMQNIYKIYVIRKNEMYISVGLYNLLHYRALFC